MKYHKYLRLLRANPELEQIVGWNLCIESYPPESMFREYVENRLRYIAYRRFQALEFSSRAYSTVVREGSYTGWYWVFIRIGDEPTLRARMTNPGVGEPTVISVMRKLQDWYNLCCEKGNFDPQKDSLTWVCISRVNHLWFKEESRWERGFEIYRFPDGYSFS